MTLISASTSAKSRSMLYRQNTKDNRQVSSLQGLPERASKWHVLREQGLTNTVIVLLRKAATHDPPLLILEHFGSRHYSISSTRTTVIPGIPNWPSRSGTRGLVGRKASRLAAHCYRGRGRGVIQEVSDPHRT